MGEAMQISFGLFEDNERRKKNTMLDDIMHFIDFKKSMRSFKACIPMRDVLPYTPNLV